MEDIITTFHPRHFIEESVITNTDYDYHKCIICEKLISFRSIHFYCRACDYRFHKECPTILMESNLTIYYPETHEHALTFIRKKNAFNCDACGGYVDKKIMNMYACLPCNFFIHRKCIYLPKVIKLTRHTHRLLHTFQIPDWKTKCLICNWPFVGGCGGYICIDKTCNYKLHSNCATNRKFWDGKDVEKEPEEISNSEDVASSSLEEVDDKTVRHFSHHHDLMRLCVNDEEEDGRICQACILPIDFDSFLGCKECDFALHDACASLPRKMEHASHPHPLTLQVDVMNNKEGFFSCCKCERQSCGFMYRCCQEECGFNMDAKCASLADPLYNGAHQHPLTLLDTGASCNGCSLYLTFKDATLPVLVKCKYDTHPLTLCFSKSLHNERSLYCEICEVEIKCGYPDYQNLYGCTDCNTTLHVECVIGKYPYMKCGHMVKVNGFEIEIATNSLSRPICHACHCICQDKLIFKDRRDAVFFCSINCITS